MPKTACCKQVFFPDRANIQQDSSADGNPKEDFSGENFKTRIPGRLISTSGDETFRGRQLEAHVAYVFECRYVAGVLPNMRLVMAGGLFDGLILNIAYVKVVREPGQIPMLWLYCREKVVL